MNKSFPLQDFRVSGFPGNKLKRRAYMCSRPYLTLRVKLIFLATKQHVSLLKVISVQSWGRVYKSSIIICIWKMYDTFLAKNCLKNIYLSYVEAMFWKFCYKKNLSRPLLTFYMYTISSQDIFWYCFHWPSKLETSSVETNTNAASRRIFITQREFSSS